MLSRIADSACCVTRITMQCHLWESLAVAFGMPVGGRDNLHKFGKLKLSTTIVCLSFLLMATCRSQVMRGSLGHKLERECTIEEEREYRTLTFKMLSRSCASSIAHACVCIKFTYMHGWSCDFTF